MKSKVTPPFPKCAMFCTIILIIIAVQLLLNATDFSKFTSKIPYQDNNINIINIISDNNENSNKNTQSTSSKKQRVVMSLTAVPSEIPKMVNDTINYLLYEQTYTVDVIYLNIPYMQLRNKNKLYPSTKQLHSFFPQDKVIINRILADAGPTTRYLGGIEYEKDPNTLILTMDMDPWNFHSFTIGQIVEYAQFDTNSVWTVWGENIEWNIHTNEWKVNYWRYPLVINDTFKKSWNKVEIFRAVNGVAFRRKWLDDIWYNSTDYNIGCFWTDDHWFSFNMERQGIEIKLIHNYKQSVKDRDEKNKNERRRMGTLTEVNNGLKSDPSCTIAIMKQHPNIWKNARVSR